MCGIVGFVGREEAAPFCWTASPVGISGYDSAGIAVYGRREGLQVVKPRAVSRYSKIWYRGQDGPRTLGLGHTLGHPRGAIRRQLHPQVSESGRFAVVHNGIIENYMELQEFLQSEDYLRLPDGYRGGGPTAGTLL